MWDPLCWACLGVLRLGTPTPSDAVPSTVPLQPMSPRRPITCLQKGIQKPKTHTDGTIRYGHLAATSKESPTLQHALVEENWKHAMDVEFDALHRNKTWHSVSPQKGKNVIDCSGSIR